MHIEAIKTRVMAAPKDDLYALLEESIESLVDDTIVVVTSKVLAIHQGRCVPRDTDLIPMDLIRDESEYYMTRQIDISTPAIRNYALQPVAGIDGTQGNGYWILHPVAVKGAAQHIRQFLMDRFGLARLGVIVTDSVIWPMRQGALGISLGYAGFCPVNSNTDMVDFYGRKSAYTLVNIVDAIAAAVVLIMGEGNERTPLATVTDVPFVIFGDCPRGVPALEIPREKDLYARMLTGPHWRRGGYAPPRTGLWESGWRWLSGCIWRYRQWRAGGRKA